LISSFYFAPVLPVCISQTPRIVLKGVVGCRENHTPVPGTKYRQDLHVFVSFLKIICPGSVISRMRDTGSFSDGEKVVIGLRILSYRLRGWMASFAFR
jgi:hypothetical protein